MTYQFQHQNGSNIFKVEVPGVAQLRPSDMAKITNDFELSDVGQWLRDSNVLYDLAMSGQDFIGEVYLIIDDPKDAARFKLAFA